MKILVIDDEKNIRMIVCDFLENEGYETVEAGSGEAGIDQVIKHNDFDLILLDVRMPEMDGYETIEAIRDITDTPVIFLTALNESFNEVKGLTLGAEDYITKPFSYDVLLARVKSALRKSGLNKVQTVEIGDLKIDSSKREVTIEGKSINLTQKEYDILELLMANQKMLLERQKILDRVWGYDYEGDPGTLNTHMKTLRSKLGQYAYLIVTVRGVGYRFENTEK